MVWRNDCCLSVFLTKEGYHARAQKEQHQLLGFTKFLLAEHATVSEAIKKFQIVPLHS